MMFHYLSAAFICPCNELTFITIDKRNFRNGEKNYQIENNTRKIVYDFQFDFKLHFDKNVHKKYN